MAELTLRCDKFGLSRGLHDMLSTGELVDVTLACQGEILQAHKTVLAACSPHFRHIFTINPSQHPVVIMQDVRLPHLKALLNFMYTGEATVHQDDLPGFLKTAEALRVSGLSGRPSQDERSISSENSSSSRQSERLIPRDSLANKRKRLASDIGSPSPSLQSQSFGFLTSRQVAEEIPAANILQPEMSQQQTNMTTEGSTHKCRLLQANNIKLEEEEGVPWNGMASALDEAAEPGTSSLPLKRLSGCGDEITIEEHVWQVEDANSEQEGNDIQQQVSETEFCEVNPPPSHQQAYKSRPSVSGASIRDPLETRTYPYNSKYKSREYVSSDDSADEDTFINLNKPKKSKKSVSYHQVYEIN